MSVPSAADKQRRLDAILEQMGSVAVAFSGGVDSAYLAVRAHLDLGEDADRLQRFRPRPIHGKLVGQ